MIVEISYTGEAVRHRNGKSNQYFCNRQELYEDTFCSEKVRATKFNEITMNNRLIILSAAALLAAGMISCSKNELAKNIEGTWQGNATPVTSQASGIVTMTDTWDFARDDAEANGGTLIITSLASVECPLDAVGADTIAPASAPYAVTVSASVTINGTWDLEQKDDDDVIVSMDPRSLTVSIDPAGVAVSSDGNPATLDSIPPSIFAAARAEISNVAKTRFLPITRLEDVKADARRLKFEIDVAKEGAKDIDVVLTRQGAAPVK